MKMCSKCEQTLPLDQFVKSPRYKDGLYPSCKRCRKEANLKSFRDHPICSRCNEKPHLENRAYCYECDRIVKGRSVTPKFHRDGSNTDKCCKCKVNPRRKGGKYCVSCANKYMSTWLAANGGSWKTKNPDQKRIATVRKYAYTLLLAGKVQRGPCVFCGAPETQFHHYDYEPRTLNFESACYPCHVEIHRFLNSMLTLMQNKVISLPVA